MRKIFKLLFVISIVTLVSACAGRNFVKPDPETLTVGKTTYDGIISRFGKPDREGSVLKNDNQLKTVAYSYASGGSSLFGGVTPARSLGFYFLKNILVGHGFTSSYTDDNTYFEDSKIDQIKKETTTRSQVIQIMGKGYGKYIYPLTKEKDETALVYMYSQTKGSAFNLKFYQKILIVSFNKNNIVTDINFSSSGQK